MPNIEIKLTDNSARTLDLFHAACQRGLIAIGMTAEGYAKKLCPVDTGRLRGSITYAVSDKHSSGEPPAKSDDYALHGSPDDDTVYIGTNVEYAPYVELGAKGRDPVHMLKKAASEHSDEYRRLMEDSLKNA